MGATTICFSAVTQEEAEGLRRELALPRDRVLALFVGRFLEKKGLRLMRELAVAHPAVHFVFVGQGRSTRERGSSRTLWCVLQYLRPSCAGLPGERRARPACRGGGTALVVQEACCSGVPVVVSREILDACPELAPFAYDAGKGGEQVSSTFATFLAQPRPAIARANVQRSLRACGHGSDAVTLMQRSSARSCCKALHVMDYLEMDVGQRTEVTPGRDRRETTGTSVKPPDRSGPSSLKHLNSDVASAPRS